MTGNNFTIKTMSRQDLEIAIEWAALEGWNPGLHDADCFYHADPKGFLAGFVDEVPVATISAVKYSDYAGFLGFYIVNPAFRGKGFGIKIWNAGMDHLKGCNIGLDGVVEQQDNYRKSGFKLAYRNIRYEGTGGGKIQDNKGIIPLEGSLFEELCAYDSRFFHGKRIQFLHSWIHQPESTALGFVENGKLSGYGVVRKCRIGYKAGPLFADSPEIADSLFTALKASVPAGSQVYLDIPAVNPFASELVNSHQMNPVFETARMYTGEIPSLPFRQIFGITSFELG